MSKPRTLVPILAAMLAVACAPERLTPEVDPGDPGAREATGLAIGPRIDGPDDLACDPIVSRADLDDFFAERPAAYRVDVGGEHLDERGRVLLFDDAIGCERDCLVACTGRWACATTRCGPIDDELAPFWSHPDGRYHDGWPWLPPDPESEDPSGPADGVPSIGGTPSGDDGRGDSDGSGGSSGGSSGDGSSGSDGSGSWGSPDPGGYPGI